MIDKTKEYIICAAVRFEPELQKDCRMRQPFVMGYDHAQCLGILYSMGIKLHNPKYHGFVTSNGRFVIRFKACEIAIEAGQIEKSMYGYGLDSHELPYNHYLSIEEYIK